MEKVMEKVISLTTGNPFLERELRFVNFIL